MAPVARMPDGFGEVAAWESRYPSRDTGTVEEAVAMLRKYDLSDAGVAE